MCANAKAGGIANSGNRLLTYLRPRLLIDRLGARHGMLLAAALILLTAAADYATGYEVRLSILYLVPIAIAAWTAGARMGIAAAALSSALWLFSFRTQHFYLHPGYYFWEAAVMLSGFLVLAWLIARLHRALGQADQRFFSVLEEMHAAVYVADDRRDEVVYANSEMIRIAGDMAATPASTFERQFARDADRLVGPGDTPRKPALSAGTIRNQRSGRWYLAQIWPIPWGSNPNIQLKVLTDITEQKNAELLREKHRDVMHQAAKLTTLAEIAATLAHEINQPLMVIATYTDACQRLLAAPQPDYREIAAALAKCRTQAVRAASTIERLREFIRQRQHRPAPCDASEVVSDALGLMRTILEEEKIAVEFAQVTPGLVIVADRILLIQVVVNLIRNAIDAMHQVAPEARSLSIAVSLQDSGEVQFSVADRGPGLGSASMDDMLSPFFTTKVGGLGLGLAICRSVAEAHGGRLWAAGNPGGGAIFFLAMPVGNTAR